MTDSRALDADRLPWLTNDERPAARRGASPLVTGGVVTLALVAVLSYWAGRVVQVPPAGEPAWTEIAQETVQLPEPTAALEPPPVAAPAPPPRAEIAAPQPKIVPAPPTPGERAAAVLERRVKSDSKPAPARLRKAAAKKPAASARPPVARAAYRARPIRRASHWPRPVDAAPLGRLIRIGTYSSLEKNHKAWQSALRRYPQMQGLPKITGVYRAENGKLYYPLYIMTTAKAQSDWLCRRMRRDWRSCKIISA